MTQVRPSPHRPITDSTGGRGMSLLNAMYYVFKPFLPQAARYTMRRLRANYKLQKHRNSWPILHSAGEPPPDWSGWPDGKRFALILTHDVEGPAGLARCLEVAALEERLGFRSCFNFIPEGTYQVPAALREELTARGFEVGVHDLHHDGSLYRSRRSFEESAIHINRYLKEWQAVGFRAGFMFHNLEWLKALNIEYDSSTFDTDPFEPQPDGAGTIFPFWVDDPESGRGYVELPYTLPQDATLYLVFKEMDIGLWKRKTAWLVERGGMVHVNVHPDYLAFGGRRPAINEFDAGLYEEFLTYLLSEYRESCWNALPRDVSRHYRSGIKT